MKLHHRLPWWAVLLLLGPLLFVVATVARDSSWAILSGRLPAYVLGGRLFAEPFNTIHAGCVLDQPTIGKWLLWFMVLTALSVPWIVGARWLGDRSARAGYWAFAAPVLVIGALLLSVLVLPLCWLVQYVYWMGFTPKRILGLAFCLTALALLSWFLRWAMRRPHISNDENTKQQETKT